MAGVGAGKGGGAAPLLALVALALVAGAVATGGRIKAVVCPPHCLACQRHLGPIKPAPTLARRKLQNSWGIVCTLCEDGYVPSVSQRKCGACCASRQRVAPGARGAARGSDRRWLSAT